MAQLSKSAFISKWTPIFADNTSGDITEQDLRDFMTDIKDSFVAEDELADQIAADTTVNGKYDASNPNSYITALEVDDLFVINKVLTGVGSLSGSIANGDSIIEAFNKLQTQISSAVGGLNYKGTWNATSNTPMLSNGSGSNGDYYRVSIGGSTLIDGQNDWAAGDWIISNGITWQKIDNTDKIQSVNGQTGVVSLGYADVGAGPDAPIAATGLSVQFDYERTYGTEASPESGGAITVNTTGAKNGITAIVIHKSNAAPTMPASFVTISGTYDNSNTKNNYLLITRISSTKYHVWIYQEP